MKTTLFTSIILVICICPIASNAQQIPNSGFEQVYFDSTKYANNELTTVGWGFGNVPDDCWQSLGSLTNESNNGEWAAKLVTLGCGWGNYAGILYPRPVNYYVAYFPESSSHEINGRPDQFSFYHKFIPVGIDTALVRVTLFNFPDGSPTSYPEFFDYIDTVAVAEFEITELAENYTQLVVNFNYESADVAQYIRAVFFSDKKTAAIPTILNPTPGTTLWIDDIELIYLPTTVENIISALEVELYPNPVADNFRVVVSNNAEIHSVTVFDHSGRVVKNLFLQDGFFSINGLALGMYFVQIETDKGIIVRKVIKE